MVVLPTYAADTEGLGRRRLHGWHPYLTNWNCLPVGLLAVFVGL